MQEKLEICEQKPSEDMSLKNFMLRLAPKDAFNLISTNNLFTYSEKLNLFKQIDFEKNLERDYDLLLLYKKWKETSSCQSNCINNTDKEKLLSSQNGVGSITSSISSLDSKHFIKDTKPITRKRSATFTSSDTVKDNSKWEKIPRIHFTQLKNSSYSTSASSSPKNSSSTDGSDTHRINSKNNSIKKLSPGRNNSISGESEKKHSPGRTQSTSGESDTSRDEEKKSPKSFTTFFKKSDPSSKNSSQTLLNPLPISAATAKNYLKDALALSYDKDLLLIPDNTKHEILVSRVVDPNDKDKVKIKVFFLDRTVLIGKGGSACVYKAFNLETGEIFSVKVFYPKVEKKLIQREINNLILKGRFHAYCCVKTQKGNERFLLMKYYCGINLLHILYDVDEKLDREDLNYCKKKYVPHFVKLKIIYKLLEQVLDLHNTNCHNNEESGLLHRDIKPENILVDLKNNGEINVTLIDLSDTIPDKIDGSNDNFHCGTTGYIAPELLGESKNRKPYTKASDFYQIGICIAEIITVMNYQKQIKSHSRRSLQDGFVKDLDREYIQGVMNDVFFTKQNELKFIEDDIEKNIHEILYHYIIFPVLSELSTSFIAENPSDRLKGSSLDAKIKQLQNLEKDCMNLSYGLCELVIAILSIDKLFLDLSPSNSKMVNLLQKSNMKENMKEKTFDNIWQAVTVLIQTIIERRLKNEKKEIFSINHVLK